MGGRFSELIRERMGSARGQADYRWRKASIEAKFGQIKLGTRFREFLLQGRANVGAERELMCPEHELRKPPPCVGLGGGGARAYEKRSPQSR